MELYLQAWPKYKKLSSLFFSSQETQGVLNLEQKII